MILPIDLNKTKELKTYFEQMDIEAIEAFLPDGITYQDFSKVEFINRLKGVFNKFKESGDTCLIALLGKCSGNCYPSKHGFCLVGNKSKNYMTLIIREQNGILEDVKECGNFLKDKKTRLKEMFCIDEKTGFVALSFHPNNNHDVHEDFDHS
jgi:hypothetical protein